LDTAGFVWNLDFMVSLDIGKTPGLIKQLYKDMN